MFTKFLVNFIQILQDFIFKLSSTVSSLFFISIIIFYLFSLTHSASISSFNQLSSTTTTTTSNQFEFMSNSSYRNFILRQYFIDLLNISHTSLVRSMIYNHRSTNLQKSRRKRFTDDLSSSPIFTLQSSHCLMYDGQVQSTFHWSHSTDFLTSIELIYHIDSTETKPFTIPLHLKFKQLQTSFELFTIQTYLQFDSNRDFYSINIVDYIRSFNQENFIIESILTSETCQTSHTYMILSSTNARIKPNQTLKLNPTLSFDLRQLTAKQTDSSLSMCKLRTIQIKFEDLGLAYLIIRPKEYTFTYCDGSCSSTFHQSSMHAVLQSIINRKISNIPHPTCAPTQFADDNFLLRQTDGSIAISPIKDVIVKQCVCL